MATSSVKLPAIIYDGDCAFCSSSIRTLKRLIPKAPITIPYQYIEPADYGLSLTDCERALQFVRQDGSRFEGHEAYRQMLIGVGGAYKLLGHLMRTPIYYGIANAAYRWIAKNRHKMPGGTPTCSLDNRA